MCLVHLINGQMRSSGRSGAALPKGDSPPSQRPDEHQRGLNRLFCTPVLPGPPGLHISHEKSSALVVWGIQPEHPFENVVCLIKSAQAPQAQTVSMQAPEERAVVDHAPEKHSAEIDSQG